MGMIPNYQLISEEQLNSLKNFDKYNDEFFKELEDWNEGEELLLDIDKMWNVLHFVIVGVGSDTPIKNNALSEAVIGVTAIADIEEFVAYTEKARISDIVSALENFDMENALTNFSMKKCKEAEIYPDIWDYEEEIEEIKEELMDCFQNMKSFYKKVLEVQGAVLITIC